MTDQELNDLARTSVQMDTMRQWCDVYLVKSPSDDEWSRGYRAALEGVVDILSRPVSELDVRLMLRRIRGEKQKED